MAIIESDPQLLNPELAVPQLDTDIFSSHPDAVFWSGVLALGMQPNEGLAEEFTAARTLRANIYIEKGYLTEDAREADGGESDEDDTRSTQFGIIEASPDGGLMRGTARLIEKQNESDMLPVEAFFPEVFGAAAAPVGSVEASRFIARHPDRLTQHAISLGLIRSMVAQAESNEAPYIYAVVEDYLAKLFSKINLLHEVVSEPVYLEEYKSTNMALRFDPREVLSQVDQDQYGQEIMQMFFGTAREDRGLGYYDDSLINQVPGDK